MLELDRLAAFVYFSGHLPLASDVFMWAPIASFVEFTAVAHISSTRFYTETTSVVSKHPPSIKF